MRPYHELFPPGASVETRSLLTRGAKDLPDGHYRFVEFYCDEAACDCRRVTVQVWDEANIPQATISYGWESPAYYTKWSPGVDRKTAKEMASATREIFGQQSVYADEFLAAFKKAVSDPGYVANLRRHYAQVRNAVETGVLSSGSRRPAAQPKAKAKNVPAPDSAIYQLKISLLGSTPPIWRRVQVPGDFSLAELHVVIQIAMGWEDDHLHRFRFGKKGFSPRKAGLGGFGGSGDGSEDEVALDEICPRPKAKFTYEYDFGDGWQHAILVEKIMEAENGVRYPRCVGGERACPPEDCGGVWGYANLLAALADPTHPSHGDMLDWIGGDLDAEAFDLKEVNKYLAPSGA